MVILGFKRKRADGGTHVNANVAFGREGLNLHGAKWYRGGLFVLSSAEMFS